jgi:hypothetical protein
VQTSQFIDRCDTNVLIAGLLRRRQESVTAMLALLDTMLLVAGDFPKQERYVIADLLRNKADAVERSR